MRKGNAFEKYLIGLSYKDAVFHFMECLNSTPMNNQAWDIMKEYNGDDWSTEPENLGLLISQTLVKLKIDISGGNNE